MECRFVAEEDGRTVWFGELCAPWVFRSPFGEEQFALLLVVHDINIPCDAQDNLSSTLVSQGCRAAVCTGFAAATWSASIDLAHVSRDSGVTLPDTTFVMTKSHENESLEVAVTDLLQKTSFDRFIPRNFLILSLGHDAQAEREIVLAVERMLKHLIAI